MNRIPMLKLKDLNSFVVHQPLYRQGSQSAFGMAIIHYGIERVEDVTNLGHKRAYLVSCKQRIIIPNAKPYRPGPRSSSDFTNYPALIETSIELAANDNAHVAMKEFFPRTLNSSISSSASVQTGDSTSSTTQTAAGSSTSQTNTFGVSVSGGFFGPAPVFNIGADYSHGWESGSSLTHTMGSDSGRQRESGETDTMSVKDWSSYGFADEKNQTAKWIWGQSYPWDVIQYNKSTNGTTIDLPQFVISRLLNELADKTYLLLPPSQLALFGVDFTMKASWHVTLPESVTVSESVVLTHRTTCYLASHSLNGSNVDATLQTTTAAATSEFTSPAIDLSTYALGPIVHAAQKGSTSIGFQSTPFTLPPVAGGPFKVVDAANDLQVTGSGFDAGMTTDLTKSASLTASFKVIDTTSPLSLLLMHWIGPTGGPVKLTITVNGKWTNVLHVDAREGLGGQNNITALELRNTDFTSINYHDYLVIGLNQVTIVFEPTVADSGQGYTLFAMAIAAD